MHKSEFLNLSKQLMQSHYTKLDYATLTTGDLVDIYHKTKNSQLLHQVLNYRPDLINDKNNEHTLLELMVSNSLGSIIEKFANYVNGSLEVSNQRSILGLLIRKSELNAAGRILDYFPHLINQQEPNGTYIIELLADRSCSNFLSNRAQHIDLSLNTTNNINLCTYLIKKELGNAVEHILAYKPKIINSKNMNGSSAIETLIDKGYSSIINKYASYIEPNTLMSNGKTVIGYLCQKDYSSTIKHVLAYFPKSINTKDANGTHIVEYLADKGYSNIILEYAQHVDLSLPSTNGKNLLGYLIQKEFSNAIQGVLAYHPKVINQAGPNGVYPVEYLADKGYSSIIRHFASHIDLSLPSTNGKNLLGYLIQKELSNAVHDVLVYHPKVINQAGPNGVYPVEYLADKGYGNIMSQYAQHISLDKPSSKGKTLAAYLIQKNLSDTLKRVLQYYPNFINTIGPNGVHTAEYIADGGYSSILREFGHYINSSHITTNGKTLRDYISQKTSVIIEEKTTKAPTKIEFLHAIHKGTTKKETSLPIDAPVTEQKDKPQPVIEEIDDIKKLEKLFTSMSAEEFEKMAQNEMNPQLNETNLTEDSKASLTKKIKARL